ncbi:helix-turn-helix domain-containing protein [Flavobacterium poyangense]|uniref:helix-turn-helix domain-containing protein n=1 Tax=Flavobacterium poyangense TaxID=2204302 RepID=UPI001422A8B8|nr:AraC family transcriptional regulator [Flavobacterium sp. JXAS1]
MKKITPYYNTKPKSQPSLAQEINVEDTDQKTIVIKDTLGMGHSYFTQVATGISALLIDSTLTKSIEITRLKSDTELCIFHFDLSDSANTIKIDAVDYKIGAAENSGLTIIDNQIESIFMPAINQRTTVLQLFVEKKTLNKLLQTVSIEEYIKQKNEDSANSFHYFDTIDSNSILLLKSLKDKTITDLSFESFFKGISLKLLGNFLNRCQNSSAVQNETTKIELEAVTKTKNYFLNNLNNSFPTVDVLSKMAGMSPSKYKILFKKQFNSSPKNLFLNNKMILANELLQSGNYTTLTEIAYELNYTRLNHFRSKYYTFFQRKPAEDFIKKSSQTSNRRYAS